MTVDVLVSLDNYRDRSIKKDQQANWLALLQNINKFARLAFSEIDYNN